MRIFPPKPDDERFVDLSEKHMGAWYVLGYAGADSRGQNRRWWCRCLCGLEKTVRASLLASGDSKCCASAACRQALRRGEVCADTSAGGIAAAKLAEAIRVGIEAALAAHDPEWRKHNRLVVKIPEPEAPQVSLMRFAEHGRPPEVLEWPLDLTACHSPHDAWRAALAAGQSAGNALVSRAAAR